MGTQIINLPSSKSIVNRVLIIEAISGEKVLAPEDICCQDTEWLSKALLGEDKTKYIGQSGTAMRFLTAFLSAQADEEYILDGDDRIKQRPIETLVNVIKQLGGDITYLGQNGFLPISIKGKKLNGGVTITFDASQSSQYVSALMLIAPTLENGLKIKLTDQTSFPYILLTKQIMQQYGINIEIRNNTIYIPQGNYKLKRDIVESDFSSAVFWYAFLIISDLKTIELGVFFEKSYQPDSRIVDIAKDFGISTIYDDNRLIISKKDNHIMPLGVKYDFRDTPDLVPVMVALCCMVNVPFTFSGVANLRIKESNRIEAMVNELAKCGYILGTTEDTIFWHLQRTNIETKPIIINTYSDHRIAMAFALLAEKIELVISNPEVVTKSYPQFWSDLDIFRSILKSDFMSKK